MIIDFSHNRLSPDLIEVDGNCIQRVTSFKLLGVKVMNNLNWDDHISDICLKVNRRLYFLKLLKRSALSPNDLLYYYKTVVRSVIEYACPVWQSGITGDQLLRLENLQRRAIRIIFGSSDYELYCTIYSLELISVRLETLTRRFFAKICSPNSCLNLLVPAERDITVRQRLRHATRYPLLSGRTARYLNSFIPFAVANYQ